MLRDDYVMPPEERRCTHLYADGSRCKAYRGKDESGLCAGHSGRSAFTPERARKAQAASAKAKRQRRYARELMQLSPRALTPDDVLRVRLAEEAVELADLMLAPLDDPETSARAKAEHAAWITDRARPDRRPDVLAAITLEQAKARLLAAPDPRGALQEMSDAELEALTIEGEAIELTG